MPARTIMQGLVGLPLSAAMLTSLMTGLGSPGPAPHALVASSPRMPKLSAGVDAHSCAIETAGVYCWGADINGELGDGDSVDHSSVPVAVDTSSVLAGKTIAKIAEGEEETCALDSTGKAYCWGINVQSGLGDGSRGGEGTSRWQ